MMTLVVPLWALDIGASAFVIGTAIAMRAILAMFFSIQAGAVMDRLGTRRITILAGVASCFLVLLYPMFPFVEVLLILQVIVGFMHLIGWIGAQALVGRMTKGEPHLMGYFTFLATFGNFLGPFLAGLAFHHLGKWGAFGLVSVWSFAFVLVTLTVPKSLDSGAQSMISTRELLPKWANYLSGFQLMKTPIIGYIIVISAILSGTYAMRHAFFGVYMEGIYFSRDEIGFVIGCIALASSFSSLCVGWLARWIASHWLVLMGTILATITFGCAPLFETFTALLIVACATGVFSGIAFPMILSILTKAAITRNQGLSVGLRATMNRIA